MSTTDPDTPQARLSAQWRQEAALEYKAARRQRIGSLSHAALLHSADTKLICATELEKVCADELDALQRHLSNEKTDEESHTRMVKSDPFTVETPRPPDR